MVRAKSNDKISDLFRDERWVEARGALESALARDPQNHWVLTQLGVTYYEECRYAEALRLFLTSLKIVPDCPLSLWNLAGALDALDRPLDAIGIYTWLLESNKSPKDDPCWESKKWTQSLKTDCVYRLGVCFHHLRKKPTAEHYYRQYVDLLLAGIDGSYSMDDVVRRIHELQTTGQRAKVESELRNAVNLTRQEKGRKPRKGQNGAPPVFDADELLAEYPLASQS